MDKRKVVSFEAAKKHRRNSKAATSSPRQERPDPPRHPWRRKAFHIVQVVLFLIVLSLFVKLCHGGRI